MANVKVYSTLTCPWCKVTKDYLRSRNVPFEDIDVGLNRTAAPVVAIDGEVVIGFDRAKLEQLLARSA
jgi:glutaredoxin